MMRSEIDWVCGPRGLSFILLFVVLQFSYPLTAREMRTGIQPASGGNFLPDTPGIQATGNDHHEAAPANADCRRDLDIWSCDSEVETYSLSPATNRMINKAVSNARGKSNYGGQCWGEIKLAIKYAGYGGGERPTGECAIDAKLALTRPPFGFVNMMTDPRYSAKIKRPEDAPRGAILVYRSTMPPRQTYLQSRRRDPLTCGHVEIKTAAGRASTYVSDYNAPGPVNNGAGSGSFVLEAVFIWPGTH